MGGGRDGAWPCRPRRGRSGRRPTLADQLDDGRRHARRRRPSGAEATPLAARRRARPRRVADVVPTIRCPRTRGDVSRTVAPPTASSSPTSTPSPLERRGDRAAARRAISRGLDVAMSSQAALGSIETRAHAAVHGNALTEIGARIAIADGRPRELLGADRSDASDGVADAVARARRRIRSWPGCSPSCAASRRRSPMRRRPTRTGTMPSTLRPRLERDVRRRARTARGDASDADRPAARDRSRARRSSATASCSPTPDSTAGSTPSP